MELDLSTNIGFDVDFQDEFSSIFREVEKVTNTSQSSKPTLNQVDQTSSNFPLKKLSPLAQNPMIAAVQSTVPTTPGAVMETDDQETGAQLNAPFNCETEFDQFALLEQNPMNASVPPTPGANMEAEDQENGAQLNAPLNEETEIDQGALSEQSPMTADVPTTPGTSMETDDQETEPQTSTSGYQNSKSTRRSKGKFISSQTIRTKLQFKFSFQEIEKKLRTGKGMDRELRARATIPTVLHLVGSYFRKESKY